MLDLLMGLLTAGGGGLFGLLGGWLKAREKKQELELRFSHDVRMRELDKEEIQLEHDLQIKQTEAQFAGQAQLATIEADAARDVADAATMQASYQHDKASYSNKVIGKLGGWPLAIIGTLLGLVDVVRALVRPFATAYMLGLFTYVAYELHMLVDWMLEDISSGEVLKLYMRVVDAVIFLTMTCVGWYFSARPAKHSGV